MNSNSTRTPMYSRPAAEEAVKAFYEKYARACNFIAKKSDITVLQLTESLIKRFMYDNRKWNTTRDRIKQVENSNWYDKLAFMPKPEFVAFMKNITPDDPIAE